MRIRSQKPLFGFVFAILSLAGCGTKSANPASAEPKSDDSVEQYSMSSLTREPVSISSVDVFNLIVANSANQGIHTRTAHFTSTGSTDYIDLQLCHNQKGCEATQKLIVDEAALVTPYSGLYTVRVRACVYPGRSLTPSTLCGAWKTEDFEISVSASPEALALFNERQAKLAQLAELTKFMEKTLETFVQNSSVCAVKQETAERINAIRGITQNFLSLGEHLMSYAVQRSQDKDSQKYAGQPVSPIQKPLEKNSEKLAKFMEFDSTIRTIAQAKGYFESAQPVNGVQTLGMAIFDIFTAAKQIPGQCLAKDIADSEMASLNANIKQLKSRISEIDTLLAERSGQ